LDEQSTDTPVAIHKRMDDLKTGVSESRVSHRSEIGAGAEGDQVADQSWDFLWSRRNELCVAGP
jgi:hypothetical protein